MQEVVRVTVVTRPAQHTHLMFTVLHAFAVLAPLKALDFSFHANFRQVCLHELRDAFGIRVIRPLYRHSPQIGAKSVGKASSSQHFLRCNRIERVILDGVVV